MRWAWVAISFFLACQLLAEEPKPIRFTAADVGKLPAGWIAARTGEGEGSVWQVVADSTTPSKSGYALAQTAKGPTALFNLAVLKDSHFLNGKLSVQCKAMRGEIDQGGGLFWRMQDEKNYYVARYNPLENNFRVYKVIAGKRSQLGNKEPLELAPEAWHHLEIEQVGNKITCSLNGVKHLDVQDDSIQKAGAVGLWTKADAQTHFDDLVVVPSDKLPRALHVDGVHNTFQVHDKIYSGSGPERDKTFAALAKLGIKTVLSVDGAVPDLEAAKKHGLRYVHVPIGYDGIKKEQIPLLVKAMREAQGPIYVHCHHGRHRGPTAAAIGRLILDERCTADTALDILKAAGTDQKYKGLFETVKKYQPPTNEELKSLPAELPETANVSDVVGAMVVVDHHFDNLKMVRKAGWKVPPESPDVDPEHEGKLLVQSYAAMSTLKTHAERPADFKQWLKEGIDASRVLADGLRVDRKLDPVALEKAYTLVNSSCTRCHASYRDVK